MLAYLDYNIITSIEEGHLTLNEIKRIDSNVTSFPYSAAHIQEADNITAPSEQQRDIYIHKRLQTIRDISNDDYIYLDYKQKNVSLLRENPAVVLDTIRQTTFGKTAMQSLMNRLSSDQKNAVRLSLGIDSKELNNYSPKDVIKQLNKKLTLWNTQDSFLDIIQKAISYFPDGGFDGLHNKIAGIYELLDLFGYWRDREAPTSNYARLWDANHAFYASYCHYLISDDKRNRNKAQVVYNIFAIPTVVIPSNGSRKYT